SNMYPANPINRPPLMKSTVHANSSGSTSTAAKIGHVLTQNRTQHLVLGSKMPNDKMSREEAERWLTELTADPERMSAKVFQEGYEASLRKSGLPKAKILPLLRKAQQIYDELVEDEDDVVKGETDDVDWEALEVLITKA